MSRPAVKYIWCVCVCLCVAGLCFFLLGLLCGEVAAVGTVFVYIKSKKKTFPPRSPSPSPAPLSEDIELPSATEHDVELEENITYRHFN